MWFEDIVDVIRNNQRVPSVHVNGQIIWPFTFDSYEILFEVDGGGYTNICLDGMGWGDDIGYIHSENVNNAQYYDGQWNSLSSSDISHACEDDGNALQLYCSKIRFVLNGASYSMFNSFSFKTPQYYAPTATIKVSVIGYRIDKHPIVLASKTITQAPNTLYVLTRALFD